MKFVIWGAGVRGRRLFSIIREFVVAFIDTDEKKINTVIDGVSVIDFETYLNNFRQCYIILAMVEYDDVETFLNNKKYYRYFLLQEASSEITLYNKSRKWYDIPVFIGNGDSVVVYGCTITSILWYEYLKENKKVNVALYAGNKKNNLITLLKEDGYNIISSKELEDDIIDKIIWTLPVVERNSNYVPKWLEYIGITLKEKQQVFGKHETIDVYNVRNSIRDYYYNPSLEKFRNCHKGKRCFVIGNGPSLRSTDLDVLHKKNEICMAVNRIFHIFGKTRWRPTYYLVTDTLNYLTTFKDIYSMNTEAKFLGCCVDEDEEAEKKYNYLQEQKNTYWFYWQRIPCVSDDFARGVYALGTVLEMCLQVLLYMGFKEIVLLGVDFTSHIDNDKCQKAYFSEKYITSIYDAPNKNDKYIGNDLYLLDTINIAYMYDLIRIYAEKMGVKICNATRGGNLEVFERVDFDTLFR